MTEVIQTNQVGGNQVLPKRVTMAYNALSQRTQIARFQSTGTANPVATTDFTYDTANRLSGIAHKQGATNLNTYAYTYDPLSRLATVESTLDGLTSYNYNQNDELQGASNTGAANESYGYDANGNRNTNGFTTASDNRMTASRGFTYLYDNEGNLTRRTNTISGAYTTYTWDHRNRLTKVSERSQTNTRESEINYEYDAFNRLVRRHDAVVLSYTPVTYWVYDEGTNPVLEYFGGNPLIQHRYVWSDNVDDLLTDEQNPGLSSRNTLWALSDHLGSIRDIADTSESTGTTSIANHRRYDSFGRRVWETNHAVELVFGYTGKLFDETTRLQNNLNRWYDSSTGRWISQDPIGLRPDVNMYRYVGNSPTNFTDPSGLEPPGGLEPSTPGVPSPPNPIPPNPTGNPHSGPTSGNGTVQIEGKAAHRDFGKGTKLPNGQITDRLQDKQNKVVVNELKPDSRLQNNSKLKLAEEQLKKQMAGAQQLQPNKTVCGRLWGWTKDAGGKIKYVVVSRWEYVAEKKGGKWIAKKIPGVGIVVGLLDWGSNVQAKGAVCGTANSGLEMIPFVGLGKGVIEVIYGDDIIPDVETKNE